MTVVLVEVSGRPRLCALVAVEELGASRRFDVHAIVTNRHAMLVERIATQQKPRSIVGDEHAATVRARTDCRVTLHRLRNQHEAGKRNGSTDGIEARSPRVVGVALLRGIAAIVVVQ